MPMSFFSTHQAPIAIVFFVLGQACAIPTVFIWFMMVGEVNRKLPDNDQIGYVGWHHAKYRRVAQEYKRLYPDGKLLHRSRVLTAFGLVFAVIFLIAAGILRLPAH